MCFYEVNESKVNYYKTLLYSEKSYFLYSSKFSKYNKFENTSILNFYSLPLHEVIGVQVCSNCLPKDTLNYPGFLNTTHGNVQPLAKFF